MNKRSPQSTSGKSKLWLAAFRSSLWLHGWPDRIKKHWSNKKLHVEQLVYHRLNAILRCVCLFRVAYKCHHDTLCCFVVTVPHTLGGAWLVDYRHWLIRWRLAYKLFYHSCLVHRASFGLQAQLSAWEDAQWLIYFLWGSRKPHWPGSACTFLNANCISVLSEPFQHAVWVDTF